MITNENTAIQDQPVTEQRQPLLSVIKERIDHHSWSIEVITALLVSIGIGVAFAIYGRGGPNSSDITLYMNIGMNGIRMPFVLNRYFNIFLQRIFIDLARHPLEGYHYYWGFLMGMTTFLTYISGRKAMVKSNIFHGVLAVLFFYSMSVLAGLSGVIVVDLPAMTVMTAMFTIYIISVNRGHRNRWIVAALGMLFFLAFKTKETTLPIAVLFIGLGWVNNDDFNWRSLLKTLVYVIGGILVGIIIFAVMSWVFLGDPFFGLRLSEWQAFRNTYAVYSSNVLATLNALGDGVMDDWYQGYWLEFTLLPFLLFLVSGIVVGRKASVRRKVLWVVPLAYTVLMILTINNRLGYETRFGLPVLPILSVLAPQFIDLQLPEKKDARLRFWAGLAVGLAAVFGIRVLLRLIIPPLNYDLGSVVLLIYYPLLVTLLFFSLFFWHDRLLSHLVNFLIVLSLLLAPIAANYRAMFVVRDNYEEFKKIILPFSEFEEQIDFTPEMRFFASGFAFRASRIDMVKNIDELLTLFNVYFDASASRDNFVFAERPQNITNDIIAKPYNYVLLSAADWMGVQNNGIGFGQVSELYQAYYGADGQLVLLVSQN